MGDAPSDPPARRPTVLVVRSPVQGCVKVPFMFLGPIGQRMAMLRPQFRETGFFPGSQRQLSDALSEPLAKVRT